MHFQSPLLLLIQFYFPILIFSCNSILLRRSLFFTCKSNCVTVLLIFNAFPISLPTIGPISLPWANLILVEIQDNCVVLLLTLKINFFIVLSIFNGYLMTSCTLHSCCYLI